MLKGLIEWTNILNYQASRLIKEEEKDVNSVVWRASTLDNPTKRVYEYIIPSKENMQERIRDDIQMDLLGYDKTHKMLIKAFNNAVQKDESILDAQHIVLQAPGWTGHIQVLSNIDPSYVHVKVKPS
jgi:hypothetical protein